MGGAHFCSGWGETKREATFAAAAALPLHFKWEAALQAAARGEGEVLLYYMLGPYQLPLHRSAARIRNEEPPDMFFGL